MAAGRTLLYLNFDFPPLSGPGIWRALAFVKHLPAFGWRSVVICSDRSPSRNRYDEGLLHQIPAGTVVHRLSSRFEKELAGRIDQAAARAPFAPVERFLYGVAWRFRRDYPDYQLHWAIKAALTGIRIARSGKADCLLTSGPPHIAHVAGLIIQRLSGIPWIMDYRDLWTDDPVQLKRTRFAQRIVRLEESAIRRSDAVVAVSPGYLDHLSSRFSGLKPRDRYVLIRNGHDLSDDVIERSLLPPCNSRPHIHFNGTPQVTHPFDRILEVMGRLAPDERPLFTFTGLPPKVLEQVRQRGYMEDIRDVGHMSQPASIEYSLQCDVLLAMVNASNPLYAGTIPGKAYEAIALGRHLLAVMPPGSVVGELIADAGNGTLVDVNDLDDLDRALRRILELHRTGRLNADRNPGRHRALAAKYSRRAQAAELAALLDLAVDRAA
jgi:glycosyltransferase involved in cell wall biosynthesis